VKHSRVDKSEKTLFAEKEDESDTRNTERRNKIDLEGDVLGGKRENL
jgi:hypothetical protein